MSEENTQPTDEIETQLRVESADGSPIRDAEKLRLVVEGHPGVVGAMAELVLAYLQMQGGAVVSAQNDQGEDILDSMSPPRLDILATGDDPVSE